NQLVAEARRTLAWFTHPEPRAAGLGSARREALGSLDMGDHEAGERHRSRLDQLRQPPQASVQTIDKATQSGVRIAERRSEAGKPRSRAGSQDRLLEPARQPAE